MRWSFDSTLRRFASVGCAVSTSSTLRSRSSAAIWSRETPLRRSAATASPMDSLIGSGACSRARRRSSWIRWTSSARLTRSK